MLADKLLIPRLQNTIIEEMQRVREQIHQLPRACYAIAYEKTQDGSPLRKFLVDSCIGSSSTCESLKTIRMLLPKEMCMDLFLAAKAAIPSELRKILRPETDMAKYKVAKE